MIWRHIQSCGLSIAYKNEAKSREILRRILSLSFYPEEEIISKSYQIYILIKNYNLFEKLISYKVLVLLYKGIET